MRASSIAGTWAAALALSLGGCDSDKVAVVEADGPSEAIQSFLEAPKQASVSGAHKQDDPHANLSVEKMAQVALQHLDEGRAQLAMDTLNAALGKNPENSMLLSLRSSLFLQQDQASLALADLNRAVALNPHDPILLTNRAQAYRKFDRNEDARRDLDSAIELDPEFIAAYFNRGSLHFEAENYDLALLDFNRCIELGPEVPAAYFNRASTYESLGDRVRAIEDLEHFLTLEPEASWAQIAIDMLEQWEPDLS